MESYSYQQSNLWRWAVWLLSLSVLLVCGWLWSQLETLEEGGVARVCYYGVSWLSMLGLVFAFPNISRKTGVKLIIVGAVLVRLAFFDTPTSDDVNRYLWEGKLLWQGENPYAMVAEDEAWAPLRDGYWEKMNHKDKLTAYPPGMQLVMALASKVWYHPYVFKLVALVGDFLVIGVLILLSNQMVRPLRWVGLWVFNPLVLASFVVEAHFDSLMVAPMITALWMANQKKMGWAWGWLGVAVQMKLMAVLVVPLFFKDWKALLKKGWAFLLVLVLPSLIFYEHLEGFWAGLVEFGAKGAFNGALYEWFLLKDFFSGHERLEELEYTEEAARFITFGIFALVAVWSFFWLMFSRRGNVFSASFALFQALIICSPVVHFWYLTWVLWLVVIRPRPSYFIFSGMMGLYFMVWHRLEVGDGWGLSEAQMWWIWGPYFALLVYENRHWWRSKLARYSLSADKVSVIIPVYKPGEEWEEFLKEFEQKSEGVHEIVVVDATPENERLELMVEASQQTRRTRFIYSEQRGRGQQISEGYRATSGEIVVIVHADTVAKEGWVTFLKRAIQHMPDAVAWVMGQRFDRSSLGLLLVEGMNEWRVFGDQLPFGDQTMVMRRSALEVGGGFPAQPLMEDVEVGYRLRELGEVMYLGEEWAVSGEKWGKEPFWQRFFLIVGLMVRYPFRRLRSKKRAADYTVELYDEYYKS